MQSGTHNPGPDAAAAQAPELFEKLSKRSERRAWVAHLQEAQRRRALQVERVMQFQRMHRLGEGN